MNARRPWRRPARRCLRGTRPRSRSVTVSESTLSLSESSLSLSPTLPPSLPPSLPRSLSLSLLLRGGAFAARVHSPGPSRCLSRPVRHYPSPLSLSIKRLVRHASALQVRDTVRVVSLFELPSYGTHPRSLPLPPLSESSLLLSSMSESSLALSSFFNIRVLSLLLP